MHLYKVNISYIPGSYSPIRHNFIHKRILFFRILLTNFVT